MTKLRNVTSMITSISMVAQWSVRLSGEAVAVVGERVVLEWWGSGWCSSGGGRGGHEWWFFFSFLFFCLAIYSSFSFF